MSNTKTMGFICWTMVFSLVTLQSLHASLAFEFEAVDGFQKTYLGRMDGCRINLHLDYDNCACGVSVAVDRFGPIDSITGDYAVDRGYMVWFFSSDSGLNVAFSMPTMVMLELVKNPLNMIDNFPNFQSDLPKTFVAWRDDPKVVFFYSEVHEFRNETFKNQAELELAPDGSGYNPMKLTAVRKIIERGETSQAVCLF